MACVLDTSALIAFLKQEKGWEEVADYFTQDIYFSEVNRAEFYTHMVRNGQTVENAEALIQRTELLVIDFNQQQAVITAELYRTTRQYGLSLGDRACLALGVSRSLPVITADRVWQKLNINVQINIIR